MRSRSLVSGVFILGLVVMALAGASVSLLKDGSIYPGVRVAGINVGGLTCKQAESRLLSAAHDTLNERVILEYPGSEVQVRLEDLGGSADTVASAKSAWQSGRVGSVFNRLGAIITSREGVNILLIYGFDRHTAAKYIDTLAAQIDRPAENAKLVTSSEGVRIIPERRGVKLNIDSSIRNIERAVNSGRRKARLSVEPALPEVTVESLKGIDGVLARYATRFKPWERDRTNNLRIACESIDGAVVRPGEVFSYNKTVGPRLKKYGYRDAPIFVDGEVEDGTGGGVCQVCTTMYNAALLSDLKIVRRSHHSRPVHYAPLGRDATVAWPSVDLKFRNTTGSPIYIAAGLGRSTVNVTIYGKKQEGLHVELVSSGRKTIPPSLRAAGDSAAQKHDKPYNGHRISIYRVVKMGSKVIKRELIAKNYYKPSD